MMCVMTPRLLLCTAALFLTCSAQSLLAQAQAPNPQQETVIRSTVRLVQVSVVVEDKKGNPVTNLKPEDFTLLDDGTPADIEYAVLPREAIEGRLLRSTHPDTE